LTIHFTTFLHTYFPTRSKKGEVLEDNLDCPLVELELIQKVGERSSTDSMRRESSTHSGLRKSRRFQPNSLPTAFADFLAAKVPRKRNASFSAKSPWRRKSGPGIQAAGASIARAA